MNNGRSAPWKIKKIIAGVVILDRDKQNKYTWNDPVTLKLSQTLEIFVEAWLFMHKTQVKTYIYIYVCVPSKRTWLWKIDEHSPFMHDFTISISIYQTSWWFHLSEVWEMVLQPSPRYLSSWQRTRLVFMDLRGGEPPPINWGSSGTNDVEVEPTNAKEGFSTFSPQK